MSTAFYPLGMSSSGNRLPQGGYKPSRGTGIFANPVGTTATHIRPFTNKDYTNDMPASFSRPRPMKHYRRGTGIQNNRVVRSTVNPSLVGGGGMVSQMMDIPGGYSVKANKQEISGSEPQQCGTCTGIGLVSSSVPEPSLSETPEKRTSSRTFCCNPERNARKRVLPANTNLPKNYYTTEGMYLYNRCQTFVQRQFDFFTDISVLAESLPFINVAIGQHAKPGSPLAIYNDYVAQCNPGGDGCVRVSLGQRLLQEGVITSSQFSELQTQTLSTFLEQLEPMLTEGQKKIILQYLSTHSDEPFGSRKRCGKVYYKPNNWQFAKEGAVSSSTRLLKLNVDTSLTTAKFTAKVKPTVCAPQVYTGNPFFFAGQFQNKQTCNQIY